MEQSKCSIRDTIEDVRSTFENLETELESQNESANVKFSEIQAMIELMQQTRKQVDKSKTPDELLQKLDTIQSVLESAEKKLMFETIPTIFGTAQIDFSWKICK